MACSLVKQVKIGLYRWVCQDPHDVLYGEEGCYLYLSMNDDLIGKFGEGFKDNADTIMVTITQTPRNARHIGVIFIDDCPSTTIACNALVLNMNHSFYNILII